MVSTVVSVLVGNAILLAGLAALGWRNRAAPGARWFVALEGASVGWVLVTVTGLGRPPGPVRLRLWGVAVGLSLLVSVLWFAFILAYTGREQWLRSRRAIGVAPLLVGAVLYAVAPTWPQLIQTADQAVIPAGTVVQATIGPVGAVLGLYLYGVFLAGLVLVLVTVARTDSLFVGQAVALVLGTLVTVLAGAMRIFGAVPAPGFPLTQVALGGQSLLWGYAVFRQEFLRRLPAVARIGERAAFETLDDGLLVVDDDGVVLRANPRAAGVLDVEDPTGRRVDALFAPLVSDAPSFPLTFTRHGRTHQATTSSVTDWRGREIGRTVVIRDVTDLVRRQQRLSVLNRILRHNVRNDMNVVMGNALEISQQTDGEPVALSETIRSRAEQLTEISEKARTVEQLFDAADTVGSVDLEAVVDEAVASTDPDAARETVRAAIDAEPIRTNRRVLVLVLTEVVENALSHTGEAPTVEISVTETASGVEVVVTDDGPGIPAAELEPIRAGRETTLQHTSGLGLWVVYWGVQSLGGDLEIDATEDGGRVAVRVPDLPSDASTTDAAASRIDGASEAGGSASH